MKPATCASRGIFAAALRTIALLPALTTLAATFDETIRSADAAFNGGKLDDALALLRPLAADGQLNATERYNAFQKIVDFQQRARKPDDAIATTTQMLTAFKDNERTVYQIYLTQGDLFWNVRKTELAVEALHQAAAHAGDDKEAQIGARNRALNFLQWSPQSGPPQQDKKFPRLYAEGEQMLPLLGGDKRAAEVLWIMCEASTSMGQWDKTQTLAQRIIDEFPQSDVARSHRPHDRILESLRQLKKFSDLRALCVAWEKTDTEPAYRQHFAFEIANSFSAENNPTDALAAYRHVITAHAGENVSDLWYECQTRIVDLVGATGDYKAALQEAHICFDASPPDAITYNVERIAEFFSRLDKNPARANQFIKFQLYGPAGPDGKNGTLDDLTNPLDDIGYPADAQRQQTFTAAFPTLGNDAAAAYHRAVLCLYVGQPRPALYYFMDAFRHCQSNKFQAYGIAVVVNGLRSVQGHSIGLNNAVSYVLYGPNGKDGKPGTGDDLTDPFKTYAALAPTAPFIAPPISAVDAQRLKNLQATLQAGAAEPIWPAGTRQRAFAAVGRLNEALDTWPNADWYFAAVTAEAARYMRGTVLNSALSAAKGNALHLGNVRPYIAAMVARSNPGDKDLLRELNDATNNFNRNLQELDRLQKPDSLTPRVKPRPN